MPRPLICLVGPTANGDLLTQIYRWLGESGGRRAVPRACVELDSLAPDAIRPDPSSIG